MLSGNIFLQKKLHLRVSQLTNQNLTAKTGLVSYFLFYQVYLTPLLGIMPQGETGKFIRNLAPRQKQEGSQTERPKPTFPRIPSRPIILASSENSAPNTS
jgi:hypothetical protein